MSHVYPLPCIVPGGDGCCLSSPSEIQHDKVIIPQHAPLADSVHTSPVDVNSSLYLNNAAINVSLENHRFISRPLLQSDGSHVVGSEARDYDTATFPPPPPPMPPSNSAQPHHVASSQSWPDRIHYFEASQEQLREAREDLLGSRYRLQSKRRDLRATQVMAVGLVGGAFDLMRRYFLTQELDVPSELESAWQKVDIIRDSLGEKEVSYEQAEKDYNLEEWEYTEIEQQFIEDLSQNVSQITRRTLGNDVDVPEGVMHPRFAGHTVQDTKPLQGNNESAWSEIDTDNLHGPGKWSRVRRHIDDWMFEIVKSSSLQQRWWETLLPRGATSTEEWLKILAQYWTFEDQDNVLYHTGDTVVSDGTIGPVSSPASKLNVYGGSGMCESDTRPSSDAHFMPDERAADASASSENPSRIKASDLFTVPRHVRFFNPLPSPRSVSSKFTEVPLESQLAPNSLSSLSSTESTFTQVFNITRGSQFHDSFDTPSVPFSPSQVSTEIYNVEIVDSERHLASVFGNDQSSSSPEDDRAVIKGHVGPKSKTYQKNHSTITSRLAHPPNRVDWIYQIHGSTQSTYADGEPDSPVITHVAGKVQITDLSPTESGLDQADGPRSYYEAKSHTRNPFAPFIRVKSQHPWALPLLRLTPLPTPPFNDLTSYKHGIRPVDMPFVSDNDRFPRLPGPSNTTVTISSRWNRSRTA